MTIKHAMFQCIFYYECNLNLHIIDQIIVIILIIILEGRHVLPKKKTKL